MSTIEFLVEIIFPCKSRSAAGALGHREGGQPEHEVEGWATFPSLVRFARIRK